MSNKIDDFINSIAMSNNDHILDGMAADAAGGGLEDGHPVSDEEAKAFANEYRHVLKRYDYPTDAESIRRLMIRVYNDVA